MSPTVLVADDSQTIRQVVQMALKAAPFEVVGVASAREAMDAAGQSPSVILLDHHMPDGSGADVCRALKGKGATAQIPVVMLGGDAHGFDADAARAAGADEVVIKPFKTDELMGAVESVVDMAAVEQAANGQAANGQAGSNQSANQSAGGPPAAPPARQSRPNSGSQPRVPSKDSGARRPTPKRHQPRPDSGSQPRFRADPSASGASKPNQPPANKSPASASGASKSGASKSGASKPRMRRPDHSSQPRIPDADNQPANRGDSQSRIGGPDVNASSRAQNVSNSGASAPSGSTSDSGVSNIGMSRAEIETMVNQEVKRSVKAQLPGLLRNIMGEVFQDKVLPKLLEHGQQRVETIVEQHLGTQIREAVRVEIERLLAEE